MQTINADAHPLMRRMHKPDPKLPVDKQDKRSVISLEREGEDQRFVGTIAEATLSCYVLRQSRYSIQGL